MENKIHPSHHQTQPAATIEQKQPPTVVPNDAFPPLFSARRRRFNANGYRKTSLHGCTLMSYPMNMNLQPLISIVIKITAVILNLMAHLTC